APPLRRTSGMRKEPPISTSSLRLTRTSRPSAKVLTARRTAAALLLTTTAASAPTSARRRVSACTSRWPRSPPARSNSRFEYEVAMRATCSAASGGRRERPRFVWTTTPVALITGTREAARARSRRAASRAGSSAATDSTAARSPARARVLHQRAQLAHHQGPPVARLQRAHFRPLQDLLDGGQETAQVGLGGHR